MSEYYAVQRSTDYLAHYGVKGMKWGVRKAIEKGNSRALGRHYAKAQKKLKKLNAKADIDIQSEKASKMNRLAKKAGKIGSVGASLAVAGTGTNHTLHYINSLHKQIAKHKLADLDRESSNLFDDYWSMIVYNDKKHKNGEISKSEWEKNESEIVGWHTDDQNRLSKEHDRIVNDFNKGKDARKTGADIAKYVGYAGAGVGAIGLGTAAIAKGKAIAAKRRTTAKGHAKAVEKRDAWQKEMKSAFKGTQYDASGSIKIKKRRRK